VILFTPGLEGSFSAYQRACYEIKFLYRQRGVASVSSINCDKKKSGIRAPELDYAVARLAWWADPRPHGGLSDVGHIKP